MKYPAIAIDVADTLVMLSEILPDDNLEPTESDNIIDHVVHCVCQRNEEQHMLDLLAAHQKERFNRQYPGDGIGDAVANSVLEIGNIVQSRFKEFGVDYALAQGEYEYLLRVNNNTIVLTWRSHGL